ncbi:MAG: hypothetical protein N2053_09085, partial [Chitinispirillaceae bacterium]|nr:hypothetical protein [Chitinispirillaceae bacterium]
HKISNKCRGDKLLLSLGLKEKILSYSNRRKYFFLLFSSAPTKISVLLFIFSPFTKVNGNGKRTINYSFLITAALADGG